MGIRITAVQLVDGDEHEHVAALRWVNDSADTFGDSSAEAVIDWLLSGPNVAWVGNPRLMATLHVVGGPGERRLEATRVGVPTRDLLNLPRLPLLAGSEVRQTS